MHPATFKKGFIWKAELENRSKSKIRMRERKDYLWVAHLPHSHTGQADVRSPELHLSLRYRCGGASIWAVFCCFPRGISRELVLKQTSQGLSGATWDADIAGGGFTHALQCWPPASLLRLGEQDNSMVNCLVAYNLLCLNGRLSQSEWTGKKSRVRMEVEWECIGKRSHSVPPGTLLHQVLETWRPLELGTSLWAVVAIRVCDSFTWLSWDCEAACVSLPLFFPPVCGASGPGWPYFPHGLTQVPQNKLSVLGHVIVFNNFSLAEASYVAKSQQEVGICTHDLRHHK